MDLYENYLNRAKKYLVEDEEDLELTDVDTEEDTDIDDAAEEDEVDVAEEPVELDMANPVCPECGSNLLPVGEIDITEEDEDGNPIYDEEEADAYANFCAIFLHYKVLQALMKLMKSGCGCSTVEAYSGWNCVPIYQR